MTHNVTSVFIQMIYYCFYKTISHHYKESSNSSNHFLKCLTTLLTGSNPISHSLPLGANSWDMIHHLSPGCQSCLISFLPHFSKQMTTFSDGKNILSIKRRQLQLQLKFLIDENKGFFFPVIPTNIIYYASHDLND